MPSDVHIRQFELADQNALLAFLRLAYPGDPRKSDPALWRWQFLQNPYTTPDDIPLWVAKSGDIIVGQVAAMPVELKVGAQQKRALWLVNYVVLPAYRRGLLAVRLLKASSHYCKTSLTLGYNEKTAVIIRRLKWKLLGNIHRYQILLFPGHAIKEIASYGGLRTLANLSYAPWRPSLHTLRPHHGGMIRAVTHFDASFTDLWQRAAVQWPCAVVRSAPFLEWQFMRQPGKKFDVLGYYEKDCLLGYVVLFFRKPEHSGVRPKAAISDLCYSPSKAQEIIDELLKAALRLALERRVGSLVTDVLDPQVEQRLRHFGFWPIRAAPSFGASVLEDEDFLYQRSNWFLTRADSDVSIFEQPNVCYPC